MDISSSQNRIRIVLAGPCSTDFFRKAFDIELQDAPPGQAQTPIGPLAVELVRRGHEVIVLTLDTQPDEPVRYKEGGLDIRYLPYRGHGKYRAKVRSLDLFAKEIEWLEKEIKEIRPDFVHAHWIYEYAEAGRRAGFPLLVTGHDTPYAVLWYYRNLYRAARFAMAARTMFRLKTVSVVAPYLGPHMRAMGFLGKIHIIPNGLDLTVLPVCSKDLDVNKKLIISAIGDNGRLKNIAPVVKAFSQIKAALPQAELHLFGPGLDTEYAKAHRDIVGHGAVPHPELIEFHKKHTHLLIHPSREEICPVAVLEAMALGIPAIGGYKSGGVPYVFGEDLKRWLVDINDPKAIADKTINILQDQELHGKVAKQVRLNIKQRFNIKIVVDQYEQVYKNIMEHSK